MSAQSRLERLGMLDIPEEDHERVHMEELAKIEELDVVLERSLRERLKTKGIARFVTDVGSDAISMDDISFSEKRALQKTIATQSQILAGSPGFSEKRAAQKAKSEAMAKLGLVGIAIKPPEPVETEEEKEFGLQQSGIKTRERINAQVVEIVNQYLKSGKNRDSLTIAELNLLKQYSGKGGLTENSQFEYYTPTHVAAGSWDLLKANGFENGNVLEPSTGHGVFSATKPGGVKVVGAEIDQTSATVNQILHPEDTILNQSFEKLAVNVPDNHYDAVIGNVPFGDARGAMAHDDPQYKSEKRIERYFINRTIDKTRPGGLICLIVPTSVIGNTQANYKKFRAQISRKAEFLGGHKLPSKTFGKQGTDVVTDIMVLRKHSHDFLEKVDSYSSETLQNAKVLWDEFIDGRYWKGEGLPFIKGKYIPPNPDDFRPMEQVIGDMDSEGLKRALAVKFDSRIDWDLLETQAPSIQYYAEGDNRVINGKDHVFENGQWREVVYDDTGTKIDKDTFGVDSMEALQSVLSSPESMLGISVQQAFAAYKKYPNLFNEQQRAAIMFAMSQPLEAYQEQAYRGSLVGSMVASHIAKMNAGNTTGLDGEKLKLLLQTEFVKTGSPKNLKGFVLTGEQARYFGQYLGAFDSAGNVEKIITGGIVEAKGYQKDDVLSIVEYMIEGENSLLTLEDIKNLYEGGRKIETLADLADIEGICITPTGFITTGKEYLNGEVYVKAAEMQEVIANADPSDMRLAYKMEKQIHEMMAKAKMTSIEDISFGLRDKWVDQRYKMDFLEQNGYPLNYLVQAQVEKISETGEVYMGNTHVNDTSNQMGEWVLGGGRAKDKFTKQLVKYMNGKSILTDLGKEADDEEINKELRAKVEALEEQFKFYMQTHSEFEEIQALYNRTFNNYVKPDYDTGDLGLKNVSGAIKPHWYQNQAARWLSDTGAGILGYDVGLGKTTSAMAYSAYDRQMGRSKKHLIVVPNSVLANWYNESKKFFGNHNDIMFVGFEPKRVKGEILKEPILDENKQPVVNKYTNQIEYQDVLEKEEKSSWFAKMHKIPTSSVGLVVMTYEKFALIPMREESKQKYASAWVEKNLISNAQANQMTGGGKKEGKKSYEDDKERERLENQFSDDGTKKAEEIPYFEDMGFDRVITDEAHNFKNSFGVGADSSRLAYLPNGASSQRARDMAMKMGWLRDKYEGKGSILLTASPVANSPIEIYNMLTLVIDPKEFERYGVFTVDDFVRQFGVIAEVDKLVVSGMIEKREGLAGFKHLNALRELFHRYANMKGAKDVDPDGNTLKLPEAVEMMSEAHMSEAQEDLYKALREEAKDAGNPQKIKAGIARPMFAVIRDMDRVTTDPDMYHKTITFVFKASEETSVKALIKSLPETVSVTMVDEESGEKYTEKVPREEDYHKQGESIIYAPHENYEDLVVMNMKAAGIGYFNHPIQPKYAKMIANMQAEIDRKGKQIVFTEEKSQHNKIARIIINNLPVTADQVAIMNADTASGEKLQEMADAYNRGDIKILIANKKAEVGVNLQKGTSAIHHLTLPWNPASIQQRNGRGVRQGNTVTHVHVYYYQAKGSFDAYRLDLLKNKSNWIASLMDKTANNDTAINSEALGALDMAALLSNNPEEFLAKMAEQKAKKDQEDKEKRDKAAKSKLMQLVATATKLQTIDQTKQAAIAEINKEIEKAKARIDRVKADTTSTKEDKERANNALAALIKRLERQDGEWEKKRNEWTSLTKQVQSYLGSLADKNLIPFGRDVIDNPSNVVVNKTGKMIRVGAWFKDDRGTIIKITAIDKQTNQATVEFPISGGTRAYDINSGALTNGKLVEITALPDDEVAIQKMLSKSFYYEDLPTINKEVFYKNLDKIRLSSSQLIRNIGTNRLEYTYNVEPKDVIYPDKEDKALLKELKDEYQSGLKGNRETIDSYSMQRLLPVFFGENWKSVVEEGLKRADEVQVTAFITNFIKQRIGAMPAENAEQRNEVLSYMKGYSGSLHDDVRKALMEWLSSNEFINKADDFTYQLRQIRANELEAFDRMCRQKEAEEKDNAAKSHPNYKKVPDNIQLPAGVTMFYNDQELGSRSKKGYRSSYAPFERLFIKDTAGIGGTIYRMKEPLKAQFGALFFYEKDMTQGDRDRYGDCWNVPATTDIQKLINFLT